MKVLPSFICIAALAIGGACTNSKLSREASSKYQVYVTDETSGSLSIIDGSTLKVTATIPSANARAEFTPVRMARPSTLL